MNKLILLLLLVPFCYALQEGQVITQNQIDAFDFNRSTLQTYVNLLEPSQDSPAFITKFMNHYYIAVNYSIFNIEPIDHHYWNRTRNITIAQNYTVIREQFIYYQPVSRVRECLRIHTVTVCKGYFWAYGRKVVINNLWQIVYTARSYQTQGDQMDLSGFGGSLF